MAEVTGTTWTVYDANVMTQADIYGRVLCELGEKDPRIVALTADMAKSTKIGVFGEAFPERFINVGIAEQNAFGMAAGLAKAGMLPFVSTMSVFASMRALEQVRTDICYQNLGVKIIATHGGISFGQAGTTHHCTEDLAIMRALANLTVIVPADGFETANAVRASVDIPGPVYIRLGRGFEPLHYANEDYGFKIGKAVQITDGSDITVICCGVAVYHAAEAARILKEREGISVRVLNLHTIKPIDEEAILAAVTDTRRILTVEEHNVLGGLGSAVADVIAQSGKGCVFAKTGLPDCYSEVGYPEDLYSHYGIDTDGIADACWALGKEYEADETGDRSDDYRIRYDDCGRRGCPPGPPAQPWAFVRAPPYGRVFSRTPGRGALSSARVQSGRAPEQLGAYLSAGDRAGRSPPDSRRRRSAWSRAFASGPTSPSPSAQ
jgi:transketolase